MHLLLGRERHGQVCDGVGVQIDYFSHSLRIITRVRVTEDIVRALRRHAQKRVHLSIDAANVHKLPTGRKPREKPRQRRTKLLLGKVELQLDLLNRFGRREVRRVERVYCGPHVFAGTW